MIQPAPRARAFTLIELLVTISIIGVLVAIITPAIVNASSKAEEVKCLANIRSIGQAHHHLHLRPRPQVPRGSGQRSESLEPGR